jgi:hypothetical protein
LKSFFTIPRPLGIAVILSALIYLAINIFLIRYPELFNGGHQFGVITSRICLSIVSGYFFYVIVNQFKNDKEKENLREFISTRLENIYGSFNYFLSEANRETKNYTSIPPKKDEINELLKILENNPNMKPAIVERHSKRNFTWFELIISEKLKTERQIETLLKMSNSLDSELLRILGKIIDSQYFFWIDETKSFGREFKQFTMFTDFFYEYSIIMNELLTYCYSKKYINIYDKDSEKILMRIAKGEIISKEEVIKLSKE